MEYVRWTSSPPFFTTVYFPLQYLYFFSMCPFVQKMSMYFLTVASFSLSLSTRFKKGHCFNALCTLCTHKLFTQFYTYKKKLGDIMVSGRLFPFPASRYLLYVYNNLTWKWTSQLKLLSLTMHDPYFSYSCNRISLYKYV